MSDKTSIVDAMHELLDQLRVLAETVDGYRAQCAERGYSPTASEAMAMDLHAGLMRTVFSGKATS